MRIKRGLARSLFVGLILAGPLLVFSSWAQDCAQFLQEKFQIKAAPGFQIYTISHTKTAQAFGHIVVGRRLPAKMKYFAIKHIIAANFGDFMAGERHHAEMLLAGHELVIKRKHAVSNEQLLIPLPMGVLYLKLRAPWPKLSLTERQVLQTLLGRNYAAGLWQRHRAHDLGHDVTFVTLVGLGLVFAMREVPQALDKTTLAVVLGVAALGMTRGIWPWYKAARETNASIVALFEALAAGNLSNTVEDLVVLVAGARHREQLTRILAQAQLKAVPPPQESGQAAASEPPTP